MFKQILVLTSIATLFASMGFAQPKIHVVQGESLDFGDVYNGKKVEHVVTIKNIGNDTLRISDVRAQCGCTATMMTQKTMGPSDSGKLSITFDTHSYNGKVTKHVYIESNDTSNPKLTIAFAANVLTVLSASPNTISFNTARLDTTYSKSITITNTSHEPVKILSVDSKFDQLSVALLKKQLMPGETTEFQAVLHATKSGSFQGVIELATDHPSQPKLEIKYFAWINRK